MFLLIRGRNTVKLFLDTEPLRDYYVCVKNTTGGTSDET